MSQAKYVQDLTTDVGLQECRPMTSPTQHGNSLSREGVRMQDPEKYKRLVGRLLYLNFIKPDMTFCSQQLSQYISKPCEHHYQAGIHALKYLKGNSHLGLFYPTDNELQLHGYSDCGACPVTRKSISGYCLFLGSSLISWKTKKQKIVSRSSIEVEYRSMASTCCETKWITFLQSDLKVLVKLSVTLCFDNQAALLLARILSYMTELSMWR